MTRDRSFWIIMNNKKLFKSFSRNMKVVTRPESQLFLLNSDTFQNNFKVHGLANILLTPNCIKISRTFLRNWTNNFHRQPVLFSITFKLPARWTVGLLFWQTLWSTTHEQGGGSWKVLQQGKCPPPAPAPRMKRQKQMEDLQSVLPL